MYCFTKDTMSASAFGVDDTLRDALSIKMSYMLPELLLQLHSNPIGYISRTKLVNQMEVLNKTIERQRLAIVANKSMASKLHWAPETSGLGSLIVFDRIAVRCGQKVLSHTLEWGNRNKKVRHSIPPSCGLLYWYALGGTIRKYRSPH